MRGLSFRSTALVLTALIASGTPVRADGPRPVRVTIWEKLPEPWSWQPPAGEPADVYDVPVIGFGRIPARYNTRGIEVDRSNPFALHAEATLAVAAGPHRLILRSRNAARLVVDGQVVAETNPVKPNSAGHEDVPEVVPPEDPRWRYAAPGSQERIVAWTSDGQPHRVELWALVGGKKLRPETGELSVSVVAPGGLPVLVGDGGGPLDRRGLGGLRPGRAGADRGLRHRPPPRGRGERRPLLEGPPRPGPPPGRRPRRPRAARRRRTGQRRGPPRRARRRGRPTTPPSSAGWRSTRSA